MHSSADQKPSVLFLCTGNSARSQMAEALLKHKAGEHFAVYSAGTKPEGVDPRTITTLQNHNLAFDSLVSKDIATFAGVVFDYVITLCDNANQECRAYPHAKKQIAWDFADPKSRQGITPFSATFDELNNRLSMFIALETSANTDSEKTSSTSAITLDPIAFYKCLTDNIRLKTLMLASYYGEVCVCELMEALEEESQPKISRNLAVLRKANIITDRKHGQWVFYRINNDLPLWAKSVLTQTTENNMHLIGSHIHRLADMENRPDKARFCH